jgi:hypothetical protein
VSGSQTHGYDVVYEISLDAFRSALAAPWLTDLSIRMTHVDLNTPVPAGLPAGAPATQSGLLALSPVNASNMTLTRTGGTTFTVAIRFAHALLSLDAIALPLGGSFFGANGADVGPVTLTLPLSIASGITIAQAGPITVTPLAVSQLFANASLPAGVGMAFVTALENAIGSAGATAIVNAAGELLPIAFPIRIPPASAGPCGIGPLALTPQLVPGVPNATADALAFLITAAGSSGHPDLPSVKSHLPAGADADLLLGTELALRIVCCLFPRSPQLSNFPTAPSSMTATSCTFGPITSSFAMAGQSFDSMTSLTIAIGNGGIDISGTGFRLSATGWHAEARFSFSMGLQHAGGSLTPVQLGPPDVHVDTSVEWWAYLLIAIGALVGAVIGLVIGGVPGAIAGGVIGALIGALIIIPIAILVGDLGTVLSGTIGGALTTAASLLSSVPMIPTDVFSLFGTPAIAGDPVIDDIRVPMTVRPPHGGRTVATGYDVTLALGTWIDLDTGKTGTGTPPPGADLTWRESAPQVLARTVLSPATTIVRPPVFVRPGELASLDPSRLQLVGDAASHHFESIAEATLEGFVYPPYVTAIPQSLIAGNGVLFGVRTSAGRYAKGLARLSGTALQLWYATYDTPVPLWLTSTMTTTRGPGVGTGIGSAIAVLHQVAHDVVWTAQIAAPLTKAGTIAYRWLWNGSALAASGTLPGGATYTASGTRCEVRTQMGAALSGMLCVTASTASGFTVEACATVNLAGTESLSAENASAAAAPAGSPPSPVSPVPNGTLDHALANAGIERALNAGMPT